jgi:hypothetical protein
LSVLYEITLITRSFHRFSLHILIDYSDNSNNSSSLRSFLIDKIDYAVYSGRLSR